MFRSGDVLASAYTILREIARTDTGIVFEARDMLLERTVAIKIAARGPAAPSLAAEARRCSSVRDSCAVQIYGMGNHLGTEFAVAERVAGKLLREDLTEPLAPEVYLQRMRALTAAVANAHDAGIAIGELSASTVLVTESGRVVLGRLSLSQVPAFSDEGVPAAPEVTSGEVTAADPAAAEAIELYALGGLAIVLAGGVTPRPGERLPRVSDLRGDLPGELSDLVEWLLAKDPHARPRSARDVLAQLDVIIERGAAKARTLRVLIVDDDTARARWLWSLARRAHAGAQIEIASEGTDAAHKLVRDAPDVVLVDAQLRGVMNALELCMYARGLDAGDGESRGSWFLIGDISERDRAVLAAGAVRFMAEDARLSDSILDVVREAASNPPRPHRRSKIIG
jgi:serine/threonine-protein kinase